MFHSTGLDVARTVLVLAGAIAIIASVWGLIVAVSLVRAVLRLESQVGICRVAHDSGGWLLRFRRLNTQGVLRETL